MCSRRAVVQALAGAWILARPEWVQRKGKKDRLGVGVVREAASCSRRRLLGARRLLETGCRLSIGPAEKCVGQEQRLCHMHDRKQKSTYSLTCFSSEAKFL